MLCAALLGALMLGVASLDAAADDAFRELEVPKPAMVTPPADARPNPPSPEAPKPKRRHHRKRALGIPPARPSRPSQVGDPSSPPANAEEASAEAQPQAETEAEAAPAGVSDAPKKVQFTFHGFVMARATVAREETDAAFYGIVPSLGGPRAYVEVDLQPTLKVLDRRLRVAADITGYIGTLEPKYLLLFNELFIDSKVAGPLYVLAGRKRVVWGSGLAANPTDLVNPVKNPLDFEQQRAGAFLFPMVEIVTKPLTFSAFVNPRTEYNQYSLPTAMDFTKPLVAARFYFLLLGTDVNLMYFYDHKVQRHYGGLSLSRYFGDKFEAHIETLVGQGPSGYPPVPIIPSCSALAPASDKVVGSLVAGGRVDLADQTFVSLEYLFNGNGFNKDAYDTYRNAAGCTRAALFTTPRPELQQAGHPIDPLFALMRQHYLAVSFVRPHVTSEKLEKLSISGTLLWSVEDLSLLLQARIAYKLYEAVTLGVMGSVFTGPSHGEFASAPTRAAGSIDLRAAF